jgi:lysophospholipase L1-like esterase
MLSQFHTTQAVLYESAACITKSLLFPVHAVSRNNYKTAFPTKLITITEKYRPIYQQLPILFCYNLLQFTELWIARQTAHRNLSVREFMATDYTHQNQTTKILIGKS